MHAKRETPGFHRECGLGQTQKIRPSDTPRPPPAASVSIPAATILAALAAFAQAFDPLSGDYSRDDPRDLRILSYNHNRSFIEDPSEDAAFARILTTLDPDVICFQEFSSGVSQSAIATRLNTLLPIGGGASWEVHLGLLSGIRTVLASRHPLSAKRTDTTPASSTRGVTMALVNLPDANYPTDLYIMGVHLKCCGNPGGSEDASRQRSADAIANWLGDARGTTRPSGDLVRLAQHTPMIVVGDCNLVGGPGPENTLITGNIAAEAAFGPDVKGDWDDSDLHDLAPADPFTGANFTWQGNSSFPPGRLDRFIFTDSAAPVANAFLLNTNTMTAPARAAAGLLAGDTLPANTSDHLPLVVDLRLWREPECESEHDCDDGLFCNGPESCDPLQLCQPGDDPCLGYLCDENNKACVDCLTVRDCDDGNVCTQDACVAQLCEHWVVDYGDVDANGIVNIFDLLCVVTASQGGFSLCSFEQADIHGICEPQQAACCPDGVVDIQDLFAIMFAMAGSDPCCAP